MIEGGERLHTPAVKWSHLLADVGHMTAMWVPVASGSVHSTCIQTALAAEAPPMHNTRLAFPNSLNICYLRPPSTFLILCRSAQSMLLFDTTTTQEQDLRHAHNEEIIKFILIVICGVPTSAVNVAASLSFGASNETDNVRQVAWLLAR